MKHYWLIPILCLAASGCELPTNLLDSSKTFAVTYLSNQATGGAVPVDTARYAKGATVSVQPSGTLSKTGALFGGWNTKADGTGATYAAGASLVMPAEDVTLHALWNPVLV